jgi:Ni,Fe-hydrogenase III small subunit
VLVALEAGACGRIARCHAHDPSWHNWPVLEHAVIGNIVPDFPLINKSFNLSYSGVDLYDPDPAEDREDRTLDRAGAADARGVARRAPPPSRPRSSRMLGRALVIRQVDAGSCNGCELEIHALNNPYYNLEGLGIRFAASPRHADMLLVTGPVTRNMAQALRIAYDAMPIRSSWSRWAIADATAASSARAAPPCGGVGKVLPVDVTIPGCPPPPLALLQGILTAISRAR